MSRRQFRVRLLKNSVSIMRSMSVVASSKVLSLRCAFQARLPKRWIVPMLRDAHWMIRSTTRLHMADRNEACPTMTLQYMPIVLLAVEVSAASRLLCESTAGTPRQECGCGDD